ncbi:MAG: ThuA domain-containing protein, partial [Polyangiaceae bacterium]
KTDSSLGLKPDMSPFSDTGLDPYDVVFFLNTTGDALSSDGPAKETGYKQALQDFLEKKHRGFVGTHSATDTFHSGSLWQWYMDMIGAKFVNHSNAGTSGSASVKQGVTHPIITQSGIPNPWSRTEEWYTLDRDPANLAGFTVLLIAHDNAFPDRPTAWVHDITGGGRVFYSAFGHDVSAFKEPQFMKFLVTGIKWAAHRL